MPFWVLVLLLAGNAVAGPFKDATPLRKCCAPDEGLLKETNAESNVTYGCIDRESAVLKYDRSVVPLIIGPNYTVSYGFPGTCDDENLIEIDYRFTANLLDFCLDRVTIEVRNGSVVLGGAEVVALGCDSAAGVNGSALPLHKVRECCPRGQVYDVTTHICHESDEAFSTESLIQSFNASVNDIFEVSYGLNCRNEQSTIEHSDSQFDMRLEGGRMKMRTRGPGSSWWLRSEEFCVARARRGGRVVLGCARSCSGAGSVCVRKCCPLGQHFQPRVCGGAVSTCVPNNGEITPWNITYYKESYSGYDPAPAPDVLAVEIGLTCPYGRYRLDNSLELDRHYLLASGGVRVPHIQNDPFHKYCIEAFDQTSCDMGVVMHTLLCFVPSTNVNGAEKFAVSFVGISISCVFLALTLIVYLTLSELRNLHGMTLISHVSVMLLAYCCLARVQFGYIPDTTTCKVLGYVIYFSFVAAFSWLNIMCVDIWWTFGSVRTVQTLRKSNAERRRFAWYSLYAWGVALIFTTAMLLFDLYPVSPYLDSNMGQHFCWFGSIQNETTDWPHYIFFVVPMGLVTCTNLVLWVRTSRHCARVRSEVHRMQAGSAGDRVKRRFQADRAKYVLTVKLWVVMGAGWVWELLSTVVQQPRWLWLGIDLLNELQGFFIFVILVLKPKVYYLIRKKLGLDKTARNNGAGTSGPRTSSTFLSRSISTDKRMQARVSLVAPAQPAAKTHAA